MDYDLCDMLNAGKALKPMIVEHNENQSQTMALWPKLARSEVRGTYPVAGPCANVPPGSLWGAVSSMEGLPLVLSEKTA